MRRLVVRRWINITLLILTAISFLILDRLYVLSLNHTGFVSGWILLTICFLLTSLHMRKKLPFLPLFSAATWLQCHIYLGMLGIIVFFAHINWTLPRGGILEILLASAFLLVALSGIFGIVLSRILPPRLARRGEAVIFERIPGLQQDIKNRVETLVQQSLTETDSTTIADFFQRRLLWFLSGPRHAFQHLLESRAPLHAIQQEITALDRYLSDKEREIITEINTLLRAKDNLDYQYAAQRLLKTWLFVHIPITYVMLLFMLLHLITTYAFVRGV